MLLNGEYIEKLSDEELCMIEQLTYLDEMVIFSENADCQRQPLQS